MAVLQFRWRWEIALPLVLLAVAVPVPALAQTECDDWQTLHPDWIFSDGSEISDTKAWSTSVQ